MKAPGVFRVLGQRFTVRVKRGVNVLVEDTSSTVYADAHDHEVIAVLGLTDVDAQTVLLEGDQGPDRLAETYLHEVLHVIVRVSGMMDILDPDLEERLVKRMAPVLLQFLRENPRVLEFITTRWVGGKGSAQ